MGRGDGGRSPHHPIPAALEGPAAAGHHQPGDAAQPVVDEAKCGLAFLCVMSLRPLQGVEVRFPEDRFVAEAFEDAGHEGDAGVEQLRHRGFCRRPGTTTRRRSWQKGRA